MYTSIFEQFFALFKPGIRKYENSGIQMKGLNIISLEVKATYTHVYTVVNFMFNLRLITPKTVQKENVK